MGKRTQSFLEENGWTQSSEDDFVVTTGIDKGTFILKPMYKTVKGERILKHAWCWKYSQRTKQPREIYLGVIPKTSYQDARRILIAKLKLAKQTRKYKRGENLNSHINTYITVLKNEERHGGERAPSTLQTLIKRTKEFGKYLETKDIPMSVIEDEEIHRVFREYGEFLKERTQRKTRGDGYTDKKLHPQTILGYLNAGRFYLDYLVSSNRYVYTGMNLYDRHLLLGKDVRNLVFNVLKIPTTITTRPRFRSEDYETLYNEVKDMTSKMFRHYVKHGSQLVVGTRIDKAGKEVRNKPVQFIGDNIIYPVSTITLHTGMRISEILLAFRSEEITLRRIEEGKTNPRFLYSYYDIVDGVHGIQIRNSKGRGRDRFIPVTHHLKTWMEPPLIESTVNPNFNNATVWETNILEACKLLFHPHESDYLFPTHFVMTDTTRPRSLSGYLNKFRRIAKESGWNSYGVKTSHDCRKLAVSYYISKGHPVDKLAYLFGHTIQVMESIYRRADPRDSVNLLNIIPEQSFYENRKKKS